jgi:hypothetical protein
VDENGPIDVAPGVRFGRDVRPGNERIEGAKAVAAIREVAGDMAQQIMTEAVEYRTSKAALKRAAKAVGQPKMATQIEKRIRELGGITRAAESYPYREYPADSEPEIPAADIAEINAALEAV